MPKEKDSAKSSPKKKGLKWLFATLIVGAFGGGGLWWYLSKKKGKSGDEEFESLVEFEEIKDEGPTGPSHPPALPRIPARTPSSTHPGNSGQFPLSPGMKGPLIKQMQQFMIDNYGRKILPRYGADGHWGAETTAALKSLKIKIPITREFYEAVVRGNQRGNLVFPPSPLSGHAPRARTWDNY